MWHGSDFFKNSFIILLLSQFIQYDQHLIGNHF